MDNPQDLYINLADINNIPNEVLEYIFSLLSPYKDYKNVMLVCHRWNTTMKGVAEQEFIRFHEAISEGLLLWKPHPPAPGPTITERYSHSACYLNKCLYVFGGCTSKNATFNDLWKLDLGCGEWIRPLAMGTYPSPKAYASLVAHRDRLILFGGWSHPTPLSLHQLARFFLQLHAYTPETNTWDEIITTRSPPGLAGHGASVIGDSMIVFGGSKLNGISCNDVWVLDLTDYEWTLMTTSGNKPLPRYGHAQLVLDDQHLVVVGGCGGPNMQFSDTWLLSMDPEGWRWDDIPILHPENCVAHLWCHPTCKVGNKMVVLSKINKSTSTSSSTPSYSPQFREIKPSNMEHMSPATTKHSAAQGAGASESHCCCCQEGLLVDRMNQTFRAKRSHPETSESSSQDSSSDNDDSVNHRMQGTAGRSNRTTGQKSVFSSLAAQRRPTSLRSSVNISSNSSNVGSLRSNVNISSNSSNVGSYLAASNSESGTSHSVPANGSNEQQIQDTKPSPNPGETVSPSNQPIGRGIACASPSPASSPEGTMAPPPQPGPSNVLGSGRMPSIRPNAMRNRQKQLEMLKRYEDRIKGHKAKEVVTQPHAPKPHAGACCHGPGGPCKILQVLSKPKVQNPLYIHTLDLSQVVTKRTVTWLPLTEYGIENAPEETIFYSLLEGRGELIMFGGIQTDLNSMRRHIQRTEVVSNMTYFLSPKKVLR